MKKPTLFIHSPTIGRHTGGVGNSFFRISHHLLELFNLVVFTPNPEAPDFTVETGETQIEDYTLPTYFYASSGNRAQRDQFLSDLIIDAANTHGPVGIISFFIGDWSYAITYASQFLSLPLFNFARGNDIDLGLFGEHKFDLIKSLEVAKRNFCVSSEMERKIIAVAPYAKTEFVANSVAFNQIKKFRVEYSTTVKSFGLIGHIKRKKGLELLIDKLNYHAGEKLHIVGDLHPKQAKFLHGFLTLNQKYADSIIHQDFIKEPKKLFTYMQDIDVVCIPSLHDGMPNTLLEAMSMGKVVMAADIGGIKDVIANGENGFLFNPFDENGLNQVFEKIRSLKADELNTIAQNAMETIEASYRFKHEKKRYHKIFNSLNLVDSQEYTDAHYNQAR